ncbi:MAG: hypothetical protein A3F26_02845 [Candidatus Ryanbacteria bacterium RIFCSPHIGHO2_12_FULL_47_12b]|nr:MAG: hypothetical protein A3F26_02845 [Candidatus Ryanbacteria bacterium RIFCSPHIGHO2_12_FULL_47_12b]
MTSQQLIEKVKKTGVQKIGKLPVVVLPLKVWEEIEDHLEDAQIESSLFLKKKIAKARLEKKLFSASQVKTMVKV